ncbi:MAG: hypothetical protein RLZ12_74 [Bacillota bacterium]
MLPNAYNLYRHQKFIWLGLSCGALLCGYLILRKSDDNTAHQLNSYDNYLTREKNSVPPCSEIVVDLKGAVKHPGVYHLPPGTRMHQLLAKSQGLLPQADISSINLAQILTDAIIIYIPKKGEQSLSNLSQTTNKININTADRATLLKIKGVGPTKAEAVITYRQENGRYKTIQDLRKVTGFGAKTLKKILPQITI